MKTIKSFKFLAIVMVAIATAMFTGCSSDDDNLFANYDGNVEPPMARATNATSSIIDFEGASSSIMASDKYGNNLYSATAGGNQVTTGYHTQIGESGTYIQFPINYLKQEWVSGQPLWKYEFWNGGFAISSFTNMTQGDYQNQCSVYNVDGGHSGKNFVVAFGYSDSYTDPTTTYEKCSKIYLTDAVGYTVTTPNSPVTGKAMSGTFNSVWVCNTTYAYKVMENGNSFTQGSLASKNGWFRVVFIALDKTGKPNGKTVVQYLANFNPDLKEESGLLNEIISEWVPVDLTDLGNDVSTVVINFEGSDTGNYGLNTPAYVALDDLKITVN